MASDIPNPVNYIFKLPYLMNKVAKHDMVISNHPKLP
jgi:hypothetical protein